VLLFEDVITSYNCSIEAGARSVEDELAAISSGHSKLTDPWKSKHVVGPQRPLALAIDAAPFPVVWPDAKTMPIARYAHAVGRFYHFASFVQQRAIALDIKIRWGGDWDVDLDFFEQTFDDLDHFELA
jgi:hypothetical protein